MSAYEKHQFYVKPYDISEGGVVTIPDQAKWTVVKQLENGIFVKAHAEEAGEIALVMGEKQAADREFFASISFLTVAEATSLRDQLNSVLS